MVYTNGERDIEWSRKKIKLKNALSSTFYSTWKMSFFTKCHSETRELTPVENKKKKNILSFRIVVGCIDNLHHPFWWRDFVGWGFCKRGGSLASDPLEPKPRSGWALWRRALLQPNNLAILLPQKVSPPCPYIFE